MVGLDSADTGPQAMPTHEGGFHLCASPAGHDSDHICWCGARW